MEPSKHAREAVRNLECMSLALGEIRIMEKEMKEAISFFKEKIKEKAEAFFHESENPSLNLVDFQEALKLIINRIEVFDYQKELNLLNKKQK